jgi:hypothetical protein
MHQTLWSFDVLDRAPKSRFARKEHGAYLSPTQFKSTIRSTTTPPLGYSGLRPQMERQPVTETMPSGFFSRCEKGARLKINVFDRAGPGHEATFQLAGLDAVRKRIAVPCKWATAADKMSSGKR